MSKLKASLQLHPVPSVQPTAAGTLEVSSEPIIAGTEIVSPLVGVVYLKPSPEQSQFKQIGDSVKKGCPCIVEAMKVMNEIVSDVDGELVEILVENEQIVEYDQPLFRERRVSYVSYVNSRNQKKSFPIAIPMLLVDRIEELGRRKNGW